MPAIATTTTTTWPDAADNCRVVANADQLDRTATRPATPATRTTTTTAWPTTGDNCPPRGERRPARTSIADGRRRVRHRRRQRRRRATLPTSARARRSGPADIDADGAGDAATPTTTTIALSGRRRARRSGSPRPIPTRTTTASPTPREDRNRDGRKGAARDQRGPLRHDRDGLTDGLERGLSAGSPTPPAPSSAPAGASAETVTRAARPTRCAADIDHGGVPDGKEDRNQQRPCRQGRNRPHQSRRPHHPAVEEQPCPRIGDSELPPLSLIPRDPGNTPDADRSRAAGCRAGFFLSPGCASPGPSGADCCLPCNGECRFCPER